MRGGGLRGSVAGYAQNIDSATDPMWSGRLQLTIAKRASARVARTRCMLRPGEQQSRSRHPSPYQGERMARLPGRWSVFAAHPWSVINDHRAIRDRFDGCFPRPSTDRRAARRMRAAWHCACATGSEWPNETWMGRRNKAVRRLVSQGRITRPRGDVRGVLPARNPSLGSVPMGGRPF